MPTYEYACKDCGNHFDIVQSFSDDALTVCPSCDGNLRKVFSAAGIIFKGSGWHVKDYADASSRPTTATGGTSTSADESAASGDAKGSSDKASSTPSSETAKSA
jgi:putative FmdB family regulatory protein